MNKKQEFLEYLKDPLKGAVDGSIREIKQLFGNQIRDAGLRGGKKYRTRHTQVKDQYVLGIYADDAVTLEDIHPRIVKMIEARLPPNSSVVTHATVQVFRLHGETPDKFVREYFISYNWQS